MVIDCATLLLVVAHAGQFSRTLMLEPAGEVLHVVIHVRVTGEEKQRALSMLGKKQLESLLTERGLAGVKLFTGTATAAVEGVEIKSKLGGPLEVMIHGTTRLRGPDLAVETAADADPIDLVVLPGDRPVVRATRGAKSGGLKAKLGPSDRIQFSVLVERASPH